MQKARDNKRINRSRACGHFGTSMNNRSDAVILHVIRLWRDEAKMRTDPQIIDELAQRKTRDRLVPDQSLLAGDTQTISMKSIHNAEKRLGFEIPKLLVEIYTKIANGGFGESYGLLGLIGGPVNEDGLDAVSLCESYREPDPTDEYWKWPEKLLPICHLGCAMYHCVQCDEKKSPIILFEPNPHEEDEPWDNSFIPFCESLNHYMSAWIDDVDLWGNV